MQPTLHRNDAAMAEEQVRELHAKKSHNSCRCSCWQWPPTAVVYLNVFLFFFSSLSEVRHLKSTLFFFDPVCTSERIFLYLSALFMFLYFLPPLCNGRFLPLVYFFYIFFLNCFFLNCFIHQNRQSSAAVVAATVRPPQRCSNHMTAVHGSAIHFLALAIDS